MYEFTDSAGQRYRADLVKVDPASQLADLLVPLVNDEGMGMETITVPAKRVPMDKDGAPYTWRRLAA